jgi:hypothetical protein
VWDGKRVSLFGARNEVVGFQIILQAGARGASHVDVKLPVLRHADGMTLTSAPERPDPTDTVGIQIERYLEHYLEIRRPSPPGWFYNETAAPRDMLGWVPDPLVPFNATGKSTTPFSIDSNALQAVWFDVYIPSNAPAGVYRGAIEVREGGRDVAQVPVCLRVFSFNLPDESRFHTMIYLSDEDIMLRHSTRNESELKTLRARYDRLAHRHRVEFVGPYTLPVPQEREDLVTGAAFTAARGYEGPGSGHGYRILPANFYGSGVFNGHPFVWVSTQAWGRADAFMSWAKRVAPDAISFLYVIDEPDRSQFPYIRQLGRKLHSNSGIGGKLSMFVTTEPDDVLGDSVDIWCPTSQLLNLAEKRRQEGFGRRVWYYNGHRPYSGTQLTDAPAVDCRVPAWACWRYGIQMWYYWHANHWRHNFETARANQDQNVWVDPVTFGEATGVNGDGVLVYAGQDAMFPAESRGIPGPVASIRLKNIRRGMQDYEYLAIARQLGLDATVTAVVDACLPRAFSEATGSVAWDEEGSSWDIQRLRLAEAIDERLGRCK